MAEFKDKLSPVYHELLPEEVLTMEIPNERFADCMDCFHCSSAARPTSKIKCCTYHPILPNYMVGAILSDHSPAMAEGRKRIIEKIKNRVGVTPYGIIPPAKHQTLYNKYTKRNKGQIADAKEIVDSKENADALQCPYQSADSLCTIWKYRTELCSTYHCASVGGQKGQKFWNTAFQYLTSMEQKLTLYALDAMEYPAKSIRTNRLNPISFGLENKEGAYKKPLYQKIWMEWEGQEIDFFEKCFAIIQQTEQKEVLTLSGIEEKIQIAQLSLSAQAMLLKEIPDFLKLDKTHPAYKIIEKEKQLKFANGQILKITPLQLIFLKGFNGTTPTLTLIKKSFMVKQNIVNLLLPLIKNGILQRV